VTKRIRLSLAKRLFFSLAVVSLFFTTMELALRCLSLGLPPLSDDRFVGFSAYIPLLESTTSVDGRSVMRTADNKLEWFNDIEFLERKPQGTYRIFCLGGSTTYGHPYWDRTSYSRWLREILPVVDDSRKWEVINAGGISYASYRVANVMEELSRFEPDLFLVYSAQNEFLERRTYADMFDSPLLPVAGFLERTRTWNLVRQAINSVQLGVENEASVAKKPDIPNKPQLAAEVDEILNHTIGPVDYHRDEKWRAGVIRHYEFNLRRMIAIAGRCRAQIAFVVPASNIKDCSPFKSEINPQLSGEGEALIHDLLNQGKWREVMQIDDGYAESHYRVGKDCFDDSQFDSAERHLQAALETDVCPLRAMSEISEKIRTVANEHSLPVIDFDRRLRALSRLEHGHECLGNEYFLDHVHPTVDMHRRLALWMIEELQLAGIVRGAPLSDASHAERLQAVRARVESEMDKATEAFGLRNLAKTMHWAGRYEESAPLARQTIALLPEDCASRFVLADSLKNLGEFDGAVREYETLLAISPDYRRAYYPFGELLAKLQRWSEAAGLLESALEEKPKNASVRFQLGRCRLELKDYAAAVKHFSEADRLYPDDAFTRFCLGQALARSGREVEAQRFFDWLIEHGFDSASVQAEIQATIEDDTGESK
jgi:tetratricopeptide (TPR) repeat protein